MDGGSERNLVSLNRLSGIWIWILLVREINRLVYIDNLYGVACQGAGLRNFCVSGRARGRLKRGLPPWLHRSMSNPVSARGPK
jgi:hypothetical protein